MPKHLYTSGQWDWRVLAAMRRWHSQYGVSPSISQLTHLLSLEYPKSPSYISVRNRLQSLAARQYLYIAKGHPAYRLTMRGWEAQESEFENSDE